MTPLLTVSVLAGYFLLLMLISWLTSRKSSDNKTFFTANRNAPWFLVAFGMIGASLSGVTFISVPGWVGTTEFSYFQMVLGYIVGYIVIATILLPLYYRHNLTSIYTYLEERFGSATHRTGASFFLLSRLIGSSFRLFLVALMFQIFIFEQWGMPFWVSILSSLVLILLYTFRGGIKTIVWTDTLQTFFMLAAMIISIVFIMQEMGLAVSDLPTVVKESDYSKVFFWEWRSDQFFVKQFLSGAFITIVMTGLDQDMMQKNLTCRSLAEAQKNMYSFTAVLVVANWLFLSLGVLLYLYAQHVGLNIPDRTDYLYPTLALDYLPLFASITFVLGLTAAAYSSADSALTALTTSFCLDILDMEKREAKQNQRTRYMVHVGFTVVIFFIILIFRNQDESVISMVFSAAGYTYGPLLGLFVLGLFTKVQPRDRYVPWVCVLSPILTFLIAALADGTLSTWVADVIPDLAATFDAARYWIFRGYQFGFEILLINGGLTFFGLLLLPKQRR